MLFSEQGELKESARLGLWVMGLSGAGVLCLWLLARRSPAAGASPPLTALAPTPVEAARFVVTAGTFTRGTRLFNILRGASLSPQRSQSVVSALAKVLDPRTLKEEDRYEVRHSTSGEFQSLSVVRKLTRFVVEAAPGVPFSSLADGRAESALAARKEPIPLTTQEKTAAGTLSDSLWLSLRSRGLEPPVIVELADIFAWNIDFLTETRDGDRFALAWKEDRTPDGRLVEVKILGAIYDGKVTGHHRATRFMEDYYDEKGVSLRKAFLHAPLNFRRISSGFTNRRFHPILRQWRPHHGTDYAAASGTPVVSVGDGTVLFQGRSGGLGNLVKVRHNATYTTYYGHLSRFAKGVGAGTRVRQGQVVGYVGSTGLSTGPHLHFEVLKNGTTVNFLTLKMPAMGSVPKGRMKAFEQKRDQVLPPLEQQLAVLSKN